MMFNPGDRVQLTGTVKESVMDKPTGRVSVLIGTDDEPGNPSREYWLEEKHLTAAALTAAAAAPAPTPSGA